MKLKFLFAFAVWLLILPDVLSQGVYSAGALPQVNVNISLPKNWRLNARVESRQLFSEGQFDQGFKTTFHYALTDIALIASTQAGAHASLGAGYLVRFQENSIIHRFIQQYSIVREYDLFRLGHRFSTDQTIRRSSPVQFRFRYRIGLERALNGKDVDPKEFYFKLNNEYLFSIQGSETNLEVRLIPAFGYAFNDNNKFEFGIDYRLNEFISSTSRSQFWLYLGWFISI